MTLEAQRTALVSMPVPKPTLAQIRVTASRVHDIVAVTRSGGYTSGRKNYLAELVTEKARAPGRATREL
jgi:hypothetical protein